MVLLLTQDRPPARVRDCGFLSAPRLRFEPDLAEQPILSVEIMKSSFLKCSRFRDNGGILRHTGLIHPKFVLKPVLKMGQATPQFHTDPRSNLRVNRPMRPANAKSEKPSQRQFLALCLVAPKGFEPSTP